MLRFSRFHFSALLLLVFVGAASWFQHHLTAAPLAAPKEAPAITVTAVYPGANANVVRDTVAAPIEEQVHGVLDMVRMSSRCTNDGTYNLTITFKPGTDIKMALVLVQNRVALALPVLPALVQNAGITIKKKSPGLLLLATLSAPDGKHDTIYLSNYALIYVKDELGRIAGVADVALLPQRDHELHVFVQPEKLAAYNLTPMEVVKALAAQNVQVAAGKIGAPPVGKDHLFQLTVKTLGRLLDPKDFGDIILTTDVKGGIVRLKDVATVEAGVQSREGQASLNGKPVVVVAIYPTPDATPHDVNVAVKAKLAQLRRRLPEGIRLDVAFDFTPNWTAPTETTPEYLLLDVALPDSASEERYSKFLAMSAAILRKIAGVQDLLTLSENPFDQSPHRKCILVRLTPFDKRANGRQEIVQAIRARIDKEVKDVTLRVRDLMGSSRFPRCAFPITLAIHGAEGKEDSQAAFAAKLVERLRKSAKMTDVWIDPESRPSPQIEVEVDRKKAELLGVALADIQNTLQIYLGSAAIGAIDGPGRTARILIQADRALASNVEDITRLQVRNKLGQMVPLRTLLSVKRTDAAKAIHRLDGKPVLIITGSPASGVSLAEIHTLSATLAAEIRQELKLPEDYRATVLEDGRLSK